MLLPLGYPAMLFEPSLNANSPPIRCLDRDVRERPPPRLFLSSVPIGRKIAVVVVFVDFAGSQRTAMNPLFALRINSRSIRGNPHMSHDDEEHMLQRGSASECLSRILRLKEVCKVTGLGRSCIYQLQAEQRFPHSIRIGARAVGWLEDDIKRWLTDKITESRRERGQLK
jgi:prophage regulatory protein